MRPAIDSEPLLDPAEERALVRAMEAGVLAAAALASDELPLDANAAELAALERLGQQARRRFLLANLGLVAMVARREARRSGTPEADLFQEGFLGLSQAADRFDVERGCRFSTYALFWIRAFTQSASATRCGEVNLPPGRAERLRRLRAEETRLCLERGRSVSAGEVAEATGQPLASVTELFAHTSPVPIEADDALALPDPSAEVVDEICRRRHPVRSLLRCLPPLERDVVVLRFGFDGGGGRSSAETARVLGITAPRAGRLERAALERLRAHCPQSAMEYLAS